MRHTTISSRRNPCMVVSIWSPAPARNQRSSLTRVPCTISSPASCRDGKNRAYAWMRDLAAPGTPCFLSPVRETVCPCDWEMLHVKYKYKYQHRRASAALVAYAIPVFHQLIEIFLHVLEHEVQHVVLSYNFFQFHDVCVTELFQWLRTKIAEELRSKSSVNNCCLSIDRYEKISCETISI